VSAEAISRVVEELVKRFRREGLYVNYCEIRERRGGFEVFMKLDRNIAGLSTVKIVLSKSGDKLYVFTGRVSLDLKIKRLIRGLLEAEKSEVTLQEENTSSS
jgi:hypothetical protein